MSFVNTNIGCIKAVMEDLNDFSKINPVDYIHDDKILVDYCNYKRTTLPSSPTQSNFRVYCLLIVKLADESITIIEGTNGEQGYIGGAICAERSALLKLRFLENPMVTKVVVTTDSDRALSPGALCREYLTSAVNASRPVVMANFDGSVLTSTTLTSLYPYPYLYRYWQRNAILSNADVFCELIKQSPRDSTNETIRRLFDEAMKVNKKDFNDILHPIRFSAAVCLPNGSIETAWQYKGLEYGCTLDPVSQLLRSMEISKDETDSVTELPSLLIMIDQYGVCHAPFAQARALLTEYGFGSVKCVVHDEDGKLAILDIAELLPQINNSSLLSESDFH
jgi:cytidine deaminase